MGRLYNLTQRAVQRGESAGRQAQPPAFNLSSNPENRRSVRLLRTAMASASTLFYGCVETGAEISALNTEYKGLPDKAAMTYQLTVKLLF